MAKRYRYAFAQRKPAKKGIFAAALAGVSVGLFLLAVLISFFCEGETVLAVGALIGGISIFAIMGLFRDCRVSRRRTGVIQSAW